MFTLYAFFVFYFCFLFLFVFFIVMLNLYFQLHYLLFLLYHNLFVLSIFSCENYGNYGQSNIVFSLHASPHVRIITRPFARVKQNIQKHVF
jgi:hypothetical protein